MGHRPGKKKMAAVCVALVYATQCVLLPAVEANFWEERGRARKSSAEPTLQMARTPSSPAGFDPILQNLSGSSSPRLSSSLAQPVRSSLPIEFETTHRPVLDALSLAYGEVRRVTLPPSRKAGRSPAPIVVHIQDVHMNAEAQGNIGKTLQSLIDGGVLDLVGLEGAFETIDLGPFRALGEPEAVRMAADYLLASNHISGPLHTAFTSQKSAPLLVGVDDAALYEANVEAYRASSPLIKEYRDHLARLNAALAQRKERTFSADLAVFDRRIGEYRRGTLSFVDYVRTLARHAPDISPDARRLLKALDAEEALDFKRVESERARLIARLVQSLDKSEIEELLRQSTAYRLGQVRYSDFYGFLRTLCRANGVNLSEYPAMKDYIEYVLLADCIRAESLFQDIARMEKNAYAALARRPEEKALVQEDRRLHLVEKLLDFGLTPEEWDEYQKTAAGGAITGEERASSGSPAARPLDLSTFEAFYKEANKRDVALSDNVRSAMEKNHATVAAVVTGGFHSGGLERRLSEAGAVVITFTPKITKVDTAAGTSYLSVFTQEKSPLENLFQGRSLFLSPKQFPNHIKLLADTVTSLAAASLHGRPDAGEAVFQRLQPGEITARISVKAGQWQASLRRAYQTTLIKADIRGKAIRAVDQAPGAISALGLAAFLFGLFLETAQGVKIAALLLELGISSTSLITGGIVIFVIGVGLEALKHVKKGPPPSTSHAFDTSAAAQMDANKAWFAAAGLFAAGAAWTAAHLLHIDGESLVQAVIVGYGVLMGFATKVGIHALAQGGPIKADDKGRYGYHLKITVEPGNTPKTVREKASAAAEAEGLSPAGSLYPVPFQFSKTPSHFMYFSHPLFSPRPGAPLSERLTVYLQDFMVLVHEMCGTEFGGRAAMVMAPSLAGLAGTAAVGLIGVAALTHPLITGAVILAVVFASKKIRDVAGHLVRDFPELKTVGAAFAFLLAAVYFPLATALLTIVMIVFALVIFALWFIYDRPPLHLDGAERTAEQTGILWYRIRIPLAALLVALIPRRALPSPVRRAIAAGGQGMSPTIFRGVAEGANAQFSAGNAVAYVRQANGQALLTLKNRLTGATLKQDIVLTGQGLSQVQQAQVVSVREHPTEPNHYIVFVSGVRARGHAQNNSEEVKDTLVAIDVALVGNAWQATVVQREFDDSAALLAHPWPPNAALPPLVTATTMGSHPSDPNVPMAAAAFRPAGSTRDVMEIFPLAAGVNDSAGHPMGQIQPVGPPNSRVAALKSLKAQNGNFTSTAVTLDLGANNPGGRYMVTLYDYKDLTLGNPAFQFNKQLCCFPDAPPSVTVVGDTMYILEKAAGRTTIYATSLLNNNSEKRIFLEWTGDNAQPIDMVADGNFLHVLYKETSGQAGRYPHPGPTFVRTWRTDPPAADLAVPAEFLTDPLNWLVTTKKIDLPAGSNPREISIHAGTKNLEVLAENSSGVPFLHLQPTIPTSLPVNVALNIRRNIQTFIQRAGHKVRAAHMPWFDPRRPPTDGRSHWGGFGHDHTKGDYSTANKPLYAYDSGDPDLIEFQIATAQAMGIDGYAVDYYADSEAHDRYMAKLLMEAEKQNFQISFMYEVSKSLGNHNNMKKHLKFILDNYAYTPAFEKVGADEAQGIPGIPVIYLFGMNASPSGMRSSLVSEKRTAEESTTIPRLAAMERGWSDAPQDAAGAEQEVRTNAVTAVDYDSIIAELKAEGYVFAVVGDSVLNTSMLANANGEKGLASVGYEWLNVAGLKSVPGYILNPQLWETFARRLIGSLIGCQAALSIMGSYYHGFNNKGTNNWGAGNPFELPDQDGGVAQKLSAYIRGTPSQLSTMIMSINDWQEGHELEASEQKGFNRVWETIYHIVRMKGKPVDSDARVTDILLLHENFWKTKQGGTLTPAQAKALSDARAKVSAIASGIEQANNDYITKRGNTFGCYTTRAPIIMAGHTFKNASQWFTTPKGWLKMAAMGTLVGIATFLFEALVQGQDVGLFDLGIHIGLALAFNVLMMGLIHFFYRDGTAGYHVEGARNREQAAALMKGRQVTEGEAVFPNHDNIYQVPFTKIFMWSPNPNFMRNLNPFKNLADLGIFFHELWATDLRGNVGMLALFPLTLIGAVVGAGMYPMVGIILLAAATFYPLVIRGTAALGRALNARRGVTPTRQRTLATALLTFVLLSYMASSTNASAAPAAALDAMNRTTPVAAASVDEQVIQDLGARSTSIGVGQRAENPVLNLLQTVHNLQGPARAEYESALLSDGKPILEGTIQNGRDAAPAINDAVVAAGDWAPLAQQLENQTISTDPSGNLGRVMTVPGAMAADPQRLQAALEAQLTAGVQTGGQSLRPAGVVLFLESDGDTAVVKAAADRILASMGAQAPKVHYVVGGYETDPRTTVVTWSAKSAESSLIALGLDKIFSWYQVTTDTTLAIDLAGSEILARHSVFLLLDKLLRATPVKATDLEATLDAIRLVALSA